MASNYPRSRAVARRCPHTDLEASGRPRPGHGPGVPLRPALGLRLTYGAALLVRPGTLLGDLDGHPAGDGLVVAARVLGARNMLQSVMEARFRQPVVRRAGAIVDAIHVVSMLAFAATGGERRRPALLSAAVAGALCIEELDPLNLRSP